MSMINVQVEPENVERVKEFLHALRTQPGTRNQQSYGELKARLEILEGN